MNSEWEIGAIERAGPVCVNALMGGVGPYVFSIAIPGEFEEVFRLLSGHDTLWI